MPKTAFILATAMPPTEGHVNLIKFAASVADDVIIMLNTMPHEPYPEQRYLALCDIAESITTARVSVEWFNEVLPQAPEECDEPQAFWDMWHDMMYDAGFTQGDYVIASEPYAIELAKQVGGKFLPYDPNREIRFTKATAVRDRPIFHWDKIAFEFKKYIRPRYTVFGAESCGKTTLSRDLAKSMGGLWLPEYARPYLEMVGDEITNEAMNDIHIGQRAFQRQANDIVHNDEVMIVQDTDLFSTVGYWGLWKPEALPARLVEDAVWYQSDIYFIMNTNIEFEVDPLRYGGHQRESDEFYWESLCKRYNLRYHMVQAVDPTAQLLEVAGVVMQEQYKLEDSLHFQRTYNG